MSAIELLCLLPLVFLAWVIICVIAHYAKVKVTKPFEILEKLLTKEEE